VDSEGLFTLGIEEEYQIVDGRSGELSPAVEEVLATARRELGEAAEHELHRSQVEAGTPVCATLDEARVELRRMRRAIRDAAHAAGCRIAAAGTHPTSSWQAQGVTPTARYLRIEADHRRIARETVIFGCHVHVACGDPETTVRAMNRVRPWLPALLALSVNSPFWEGADTGFSSFRSTVWRRWPTSAAPLPFDGHDEYDRLVGALLDTGAIDDPARLYWDVRPSARYPTLEFRVADACTRIDETLMVAGLCRAVAERAVAAERDGEPDEAVRPELLEGAIWQAARDGVDGELIDPRIPARVAAADLVESLLEHVGPVLAARGDANTVERAVETTLRDGTGASRQRLAQRRRGRLADVIQLLVDETEAGLD
jgi:carboxylate-amine ligase